MASNKIRICMVCRTAIPSRSGGPFYCRQCGTEKTKQQRTAAIEFHRALRQGDLVRQPCETCGNDNSQGHHDDYSKPLDVRWLCRSHHYQHHRDLYRAAVA